MPKALQQHFFYGASWEKTSEMICRWDLWIASVNSCLRNTGVLLDRSSWQLLAYLLIHGKEEKHLLHFICVALWSIHFIDCTLALSPRNSRQDMECHCSKGSYVFVLCPFSMDLLGVIHFILKVTLGGRLCPKRTTSSWPPSEISGWIWTQIFLI